MLESEDWLAVLVGFLSLLLVLVGVRPALPEFGWTSMVDLSGTLLTTHNLTKTLVAGVGLGVLAGAGVFFMSGSLARFALGFPVVYGLSWLSQILAGHSVVSGLGLEYVIFALGLGLFVSNVIGVPAWLKEAARTEYYIKTGLVILGASMLFADLARGGLLGIVQAVLVVVPVWFVCFWLARRFQVADELATSWQQRGRVCGVSAAIAACGAIRAIRKTSRTCLPSSSVAAPRFVRCRDVNAFGSPDSWRARCSAGRSTLARRGGGGEVISNARAPGVVVNLSQNVSSGWRRSSLRSGGTRNPREAISPGRGCHLGTFSEIRAGVPRGVARVLVPARPGPRGPDERRSGWTAHDVVCARLCIDWSRNQVC